ncbi:MAG: VCBS repeat-containing protein, partial [Ignavibacteria bacterium]|nr:VCBS repeat-containing protein [Ignavibacteria bacterium]
FINEGNLGVINYRYEPKYEKSFDVIYKIVILADYNGDGKVDLFTTDALGVGLAVYKNISNNPDEVKFSLACSLITYPFGFQFETNLYANETDYPSILDVDGDGDLDILNFEFSNVAAGDGIIYYKNNSMELYGKKDSLNDFAISRFCWGRFREDPNTCSAKLADTTTSVCVALIAPKLLDFNDVKKIQNNNAESKSNLHAGSTVLAFDANGDGLLDLLVGDISCNNMYLVTNGGTNENANMTAVDYSWPTAYPINVPVFPAAFHMDVNNDGLKDLIVAPNVSNSSENYKGCWLYLNLGTATAPDFTFITDQFLSNEMLEFGEGSYPHFFDYNNDGLKDILVGNRGYFNQGSYKGGVAVLQNIGNAQTPSYELVNRNYSDINSYNINDIYLSSADLDGDNDQDLLLGENAGTAILLRNTAGPSNIPSFVLGAANYQGIDVSTYSTPYLIDFDLDGKTDLLFGFKATSGSKSFMKYYKNYGTSTNPQFLLEKDTLGNIFGNFSNPSGGFSSLAIADMNVVLTLEILMSDNTGLIRVYAINESNLKGTFQFLYSFNPEMGLRISLAVADVNEDNQMDLLIGSYRGGISIFKQDNSSGIQINKNELLVMVYPNPASDFVNIQLGKENKNLKTNIFSKDRFGYDVLCHTDLSRSSGESYGIPLNRINWGN